MIIWYPIREWENSHRNINIIFYTTLTSQHKEIIIAPSVLISCNMGRCRSVQIFLCVRCPNSSITEWEIGTWIPATLESVPIHFSVFSFSSSKVFVQFHTYIDNCMIYLFIFWLKFLVHLMLHSLGHGRGEVTLTSPSIPLCRTCQLFFKLYISASSCYGFRLIHT